MQGVARHHWHFDEVSDPIWPAGQLCDCDQAYLDHFRKCVSNGNWLKPWYLECSVQESACVAAKVAIETGRKQ